MGASSEDISDGYDCPTCGKTFGGKMPASVHHSKMHGESIRDMEARQGDFPCPYDGCEIAYDTQRMMRIHHKKEHGISLAGFDKTCPVCEEEFTTQERVGTYCSLKCRSEVVHKSGEEHASWRGGLVRKECDYCGSPYEVNLYRKDDARFCSRLCGAKQRSDDSDGETFYYGPNWQEQRVRALERDGYVCYLCDRENQDHKSEFGESLHVHHIIPLRTFAPFEDIESYERANHLSNLITLCMPCHNIAERMAPLLPHRP